MALHNQIVELLKSLPNIHNKGDRQALIFSASLDKELEDQIECEGTTAQFCQLLVKTLATYGTLQDGRHALVTILEAAKNHVGQEGRKQCDELIEQFHENLQERLQQPSPLSGIPAQHQGNPLNNAFLDVSKFVGRERELDLLAQAVWNPDYKVIVIDGLAGIGKSALIAKFVQDTHRCLYNSDQILRIDCTEYQSITDIYRRLSKIFEYYQNDALATSLKNLPENAGDAEYADKSQEIITNLGHWLLIFDNFEGFLFYERDWEEDDLWLEKDLLEIADSRVERFFQLLLDCQHSAKTMITSRATPRLKGNRSYVCRPLEGSLTGLSISVFRTYASKMTAYPFSEEDWRLIEEKIAGHPKAFEFLCQLLHEQGHTVETLLHPIEINRATDFQRAVARHFLKQLFERLTLAEQEILRVVCVLRKPFSQKTVAYLLTQHGKPTPVLKQQLKTLEERSFLEKIGQNEWSLHAIVRDFLQLAYKKDLEYLHHIAAEYYNKHLPENFSQLSDIDGILEALYHYEQASASIEYEQISTLLSRELKHMGYRNYRKGIWNEAIKAFKLRIEYDPDNWQPYFYYGICLKKQGKYDQANKQFESSLATSPDNRGKAKILNAYAICLREQGMNKQAIELFETALSIDTDDRQKAITFQVYATCLMEQHQYVEANKKYEQSLALDPSPEHKAITLQVYATCLIEQKKYIDAIKKYEESLMIEPDIEHRAITLNAYAHLFMEQQQYSQAECLLKKELSQYPPNHPLRFTWLQTLVKIGDFEIAAHESEQLIQQSPDNPELYNQRANVLAAMQKWEEAEQSYRKAFQLAQKSRQRAQYLNNIAKLILEMGAVERYDEGIELCEQAHKLNPSFRWSLKTKEELLKKKREAMASEESA